MKNQFLDTSLDSRLLQTEQVIKALAHRSRLLIVQTIGRGEACVSDLQHVVGSDMSTVSKHLTVLKSAGVVMDRKVGLQVYYRLRIPCIVDFVQCIGAVMMGEPLQMSDEMIEKLKG
jgi:DNA-binding transcriptional ArsR family regulator